MCFDGNASPGHGWPKTSDKSDKNMRKGGKYDSNMSKVLSKQSKQEASGKYVVRCCNFLHVSYVSTILPASKLSLSSKLLLWLKLDCGSTSPFRFQRGWTHRVEPCWWGSSCHELDPFATFIWSRFAVESQKASSHYWKWNLKSSLRDTLESWILSLIQTETMKSNPISIRRFFMILPLLAFNQS